MKKSVVFFAVMFIVLGFSSNVIAQNLAIGARAGLMWNNVTSRELGNTLTFESISTPSVGVVFNASLMENLAFHTELNYTEKGFRTNIGTDVSLFGTQLPIGARANTTVKYIDIPLALKYSIGQPDGVQFFAIAGPSLGYAMSGELETFAKVLIDVKVSSTPIDLSSQNYKRFEVGGIVGLGVSAPLGNGRVFLDGRYTTSFMDVYEVPVVGANVRNQGYGVSLGYIMNL